jgi:Cu2+-containing amine oxidase
MAHISDAEVSILLNAFTKVKAALGQDKSPAAQNILKGINESEKIVKSKMAAATTPMGGSASISKNLFQMFGLTHRLR